jgi:hypothetical protein
MTALVAAAVEKLRATLGFDPARCEYVAAVLEDLVCLELADYFGDDDYLRGIYGDDVLRSRIATLEAEAESLRASTSIPSNEEPELKAADLTEAIAWSRIQIASAHTRSDVRRISGMLCDALARADRKAA